MHVHMANEKAVLKREQSWWAKTSQKMQPPLSHCCHMSDCNSAHFAHRPECQHLTYAPYVSKYSSPSLSICMWHFVTVSKHVAACWLHNYCIV